MTPAPEPTSARPRIAVFAGPNATILNTPPLVTGRSLRPQRLAAPVTVWIEAHTAHPLAADTAHLDAPPEGWIEPDGTVHPEPHPGAVPAHRVVLAPDDGLHLLPYVTRRADGSPWEHAGTGPAERRERSRQTFLPDAARLYEEIDRFGVGYDGRDRQLSSKADFVHLRAAPSGGPAPEVEGKDYFAYFPYHLATEPSTVHLAAVTNLVQRTLGAGGFAGAQWLEGSPTVEETLYWLGLLVDTTLPIVGHAAQRAHQTTSADGDRNLVDGVDLICSGAWADAEGANRFGAVLVVDELVFSAREVAKTDARPGNYVAVGGHGGVVATFGGDGPIHATFVPVRRHTHTSELRLTALPRTVDGVRATGDPTAGRVEVVPVAVTADDGDLLAGAVPRVTIHTYARYQPPVTDGVPDEPAIDAELADALQRFPLAGMVAEGNSPYVTVHPGTDAALLRAVHSGLPVVKVGRGHPGGDAHRRDPRFVAGNDLTPTKARILLMASLLKLGALPPAADPAAPTEEEELATLAAVARYQAIFDTH